MPTEAEWEYAARGGAGYYGSPQTQEINHDSSPNNGTRSVDYQGSNLNGYGLADTLGNVWEWTWDFYDSNGDRVIRGGGWYYAASFCRVANRRSSNPYDDDYFYLGFRVCLSVFE